LSIEHVLEELLEKVGTSCCLPVCGVVGVLTHYRARVVDVTNTLPQQYVPPNGRYAGFENGVAFKKFMHEYRDEQGYKGILIALIVFGDGFV
jgi:hypothetical protein